jgi:23S rRNA pseudouridine2605 synthase
LTHPSNQKEKVYLVTLNKPLKPTDQKVIVKGGVTLAEGVSNMRVKILNDQELEVVLTEGRKRQIRRTFELIGYKVLKLHRTRFGEYVLNDLPSGSFKIIKIRP